jgi:hypothetical protein
MEKSLDNSREYSQKAWIRFLKTRPSACWPLMKNYYQCFDHFHFEKNQDKDSAKTTCLEKFNYEECLTENKEKLKENWIYNLEIAE